MTFPSGWAHQRTTAPQPWTEESQVTTWASPVWPAVKASYNELGTDRLGHGSAHCTTPSHVPARLRQNRTTDGLTSPARSRLLTPTGSLYGPGLVVSRPRQGSNPSNGIHNHRNCRPGWRTRWVQLPPAAHRSTHALARVHVNLGHTGKAQVQATLSIMMVAARGTELR